MSEMSAELGRNVDEENAKRFRGASAFEQMVAIGGQVSKGEAKQAGWTPELLEDFNSAVRYEMSKNNSKGVGEDILGQMQQGLEKAGMNPHRDTDGALLVD